MPGRFARVRVQADPEKHEPVQFSILESLFASLPVLSIVNVLGHVWTDDGSVAKNKQRQYLDRSVNRDNTLTDH